MEEIDHLKDLGVKHYSNIFKDDGNTSISDQLKIIQLFPSMLSEEEASMFTTEVTLVEVEGALKAFKRDNILGLDGWPAEFYLGIFDLVGEDLLKAVEFSRKEGRVITYLNSTYLNLIPKSERPQTFVNCRPISLCNRSTSLSPRLRPTD